VGRGKFQDCRSESARGARLDFADGFGSSDMAAEVAATADTIYPISSMTKTFTAAAVMQLVQAGKLSLSDNLAGFFPGLPWGHQVTISELLDHTSGIADYINSKGSLLGDDCPAPSGAVAGCRRFGPSQVVKWLANRPLQFAPGTKWAYSNSNYYLLGLVIERVSGQPYLTYLKAHVLGTLGLTHTKLCPDSPEPPEFAVGYITNTTTTAPWAAVGEGAIPRFRWFCGRRALFQRGGPPQMELRACPRTSGLGGLLRPHDQVNPVGQRGDGPIWLRPTAEHTPGSWLLGPPARPALCRPYRRSISPKPTSISSCFATPRPAQTSPSVSLRACCVCSMSALEQVMEPLPIGVRQPPRPPRPPAPPITGGNGGYGSSWERPLRGPYRPKQRNFLHEVIVEMRKVVWPTRNDLAHNAAVCLGVLGLSIGAIASVDVGLVALIRVATGGG
jgi:preprotein translocase SecE subunit